MVQLSHLYMLIGKTTMLTIWTFVGKVMSLLFNTLSRFVRAFFPRSKCNLISCLQLPFAVILKCHCFDFFFYYLPWSDGMRCHDLSFNGEFQASFFTSSFTLIKKFFSSSSLSALRVLPAYLRLLLFLPEILIPACDSSSPEFCIIYFACKLNKLGNNIQSSCTPFPILSESVVSCLGLSVASWSVYRFLRRHVRWSGTPNSKNFHSLFWSITSQRFLYSQWSRSRCFSETSLLSPWSNKCWQFDLFPLLLQKPPHKSAYSWFRHCCGLAWRILSIILLAYEMIVCNCMLIWIFFGIGMKSDLFQSWWPHQSFPNLLTYWVKHINSIIF